MSLKQATMHIAAGGSAGFIEICINHPLDLVKTRFQLQTTKAPGNVSDPHYYNGITDCIKKMYKYEGLPSFWKGILPPILAVTPLRAVKFASFEQYKKVFMFGSSTATPLSYSLAGLVAGMTEGLLKNPFEVVKVTLQSNRQLSTEAPSTWSVTRQILKEHGFGSKGLNKGLNATMARHGVFNMAYYGFYHSTKDYIPAYQDPLLEFGRKLGIGLISGILGSCLNIPFDVAKSRIQGPQPTPGVIKYKTTTAAIALIYREEGFRALYKGLLLKVLRLGPGGAIMLVVYDYGYHYLEEKFQ